MKKLIAIVVLASGCVTLPPAEGKRRMLSWGLRQCLKSYPKSYIFRERCFTEYEQRCLAAGLEKSCAADDLYTNPPGDDEFGGGR